MKLILLGGGIDSTTLIMWLRKEYPKEELAGLFINYGQKACLGERLSSQYFCEKYDVSFKEIQCEIDKITNSPILWRNQMATDHKNNKLEARNIIFLSLATTYASTIGADEIFVAFHKEPKPAPFPDATYETTRAFNGLLNFCLPMGTKLKVSVPFRNKTREEIFELGLDLDVQIYTHSYTCYEDFAFPELDRSLSSCGECTHCLKKKEMIENIRPGWFD